MSSSRRRYGIAFLWAIALGLWFVPAFPEPPLHTGCYVQSVTTDSAIIARIEPTPVARSLVVRDEAGEQVRELPLSVPRRRHRFDVDGLSPFTVYRYEMRDVAGAVIDRGEFRTAPGDAEHRVTFCVVGDSGGLPWWVWLQNNPLFQMVARYDWLPIRASVAGIGAAMARARPDLWLHVGDVVYPRGEHRHYSPGFFRPFAELLRRAPVYFALGNHDLVNDNGRQLLANFYLPENSVSGDERFYTFGWGAVRFVSLDLNREITDEDPAIEFLERKVAGTSEPWRVVFAHYPAYSASRQGDRTDLIQHLLPVLERCQVDLMFVGHDHNYQRFGEPEPVTYPVLIVSGGGGKSLYPLKDHPKLTAANHGYHFCKVIVDRDQLTVEATAAEDVVVDRFVLNLADRVGGAGAVPARDSRRRALLR